MRSRILVAVLLLVYPFGGEARDPIRTLLFEGFSFRHAGEEWVCTYLVADDELSTSTYGPIVICPRALANRVRPGRDGTENPNGYCGLISGPAPNYRWYIMCDKFQIKVVRAGFYCVGACDQTIVVTPLDAAVPAVLGTPSERMVSLLKALGEDGASGRLFAESTAR